MDCPVYARVCSRVALRSAEASGLEGVIFESLDESIQLNSRLAACLHGSD
jgi:hypothetical protein